MKYKTLETVVLNTDMPRHGLRAGDVGVVVESNPTSTYEVEFVKGSGHTQALVTLTEYEIRPILPAELLAVRPVDPA